MKTQKYYLGEHLQDYNNVVAINGVVQLAIDISIKDEPT